MLRALRPRAVAAAIAVVVAVGAAGCGGKGGDDGALNGPVPPGQANAIPTYPQVPYTQATNGGVPYPVLSKTPKAAALNAAIAAQAAGLAKRGVACSVNVLRSDTRLVSVAWTCAGQDGVAATYSTEAGTQVGLGQLFTSGYLNQLSATAITQLQAGGASASAARKAAAPTAASFAEWAVDPQSLEVTFEVSGHPATISFPLPSLQSITDQQGPLRTGN